jgi:hypothetical protein
MADRSRPPSRARTGSVGTTATADTHTQDAAAQSILSTDFCMLIDRPPDPVLRAKFEVMPVTTWEINNVPTLSCQGTNTLGRPAKASGMLHGEGGWPAAVDAEETDERIKYCKRVQREEAYLRAVATLLGRVMPPLRTNAAIDIYPIFFEEGDASSAHLQGNTTSGSASDAHRDDDAGSQQNSPQRGTLSTSSTRQDTPNNDAHFTPLTGINRNRVHRDPRGYQIPQYSGDDVVHTFCVAAKMVSGPKATHPLSPTRQSDTAAAATAAQPTMARRGTKEICWLMGDGTKFAAVYPAADTGSTPSDATPSRGSIHDAHHPSLVETTRAGALWDVANASDPVAWLHAPACWLTCINGSPRDSFILVAGSSSGLALVYDTREKHRGEGGVAAPVLSSTLLHGHGGPVAAVRCAVAKGLEFFTAGTDGKLLYWDARNLSAPTDCFMLSSTTSAAATAAAAAAAAAAGSAELSSSTSIRKAVQSASALYSVTCLDYDAVHAASAKLLLGTADGSIVVCSRAAGRSGGDRIAARINANFGPVRDVSRHPFAAKMFAAAGDWGLKIFSEELRTPIVATPSQASRITAGKWHPVRPAIYLSGDAAGSLHVWDMLVSLDAPVLSLSIDNHAAVTAIAPHPTGTVVAVGDASGAVSLVRMPEVVATCSDREERGAVGALLDREAARERASAATLDARTKRRTQQLKGTAIESSPAKRPGIFAASTEGRGGPSVEDDAETAAEMIRTTSMSQVVLGGAAARKTSTVRLGESGRPNDDDAVARQVFVAERAFLSAVGL